MILTGDFNLNLLKFGTNTEVNDFLDLVTRKWFTPHILSPTRITLQDKPSFIDNIFLNFNDMHCYSGNLIEKITHHLPNFLIIEKLTVKLDNQDRPLKRDLKNFDEDKLVIDIEKLNLKQKIENTRSQINQKYTSFHENIMKVIDKNATLKISLKKNINDQKIPG